MFWDMRGLVFVTTSKFSKLEDCYIEFNVHCHEYLKNAFIPSQTMFGRKVGSKSYTKIINLV